MEDQCYYPVHDNTSGGVLESCILEDENNNSKTYVQLEVIQRNPNTTYDSAAMQLADQTQILFNYDSSAKQFDQLSYHHSHHQNHHQGLLYHDLDSTRDTHHQQQLLDLDCQPKHQAPYDSIKSVLMLKDMTGEPHHQPQQQQRSPQMTHHLHSSSINLQQIKLEPQFEGGSRTENNSGGGGGGGVDGNGGQLPFWKERALQIERGSRE